MNSSAPHSSPFTRRTAFDLYGCRLFLILPKFRCLWCRLSETVGKFKCHKQSLVYWDWKDDSRLGYCSYFNNKCVEQLSNVSTQFVFSVHLVGTQLCRRPVAQGAENKPPIGWIWTLEALTWKHNGIRITDTRLTNGQKNSITFSVSIFTALNLALDILR